MNAEDYIVPAAAAAVAAATYDYSNEIGEEEEQFGGGVGDGEVPQAPAAPALAPAVSDGGVALNVEHPDEICFDRSRRYQ